MSLIFQEHSIGEDWFFPSLAMIQSQNTSRLGMGAHAHVTWLCWAPIWLEPTQALCVLPRFREFIHASCRIHAYMHHAWCSWETLFPRSQASPLTLKIFFPLLLCRSLNPKGRTLMQTFLLGPSLAAHCSAGDLFVSFPYCKKKCLHERWVMLGSMGKATCH